jgi:hypothetical protein
MGPSAHGGVDIHTTAGHEDYDLVGDEHVVVMEELLNGFRTGDQGAPGRAMDPDVVIVQPASTPFGGLHHGLEGVRTMLEQMERHWTRRWNWVHRHPCREFVVNHEEVVWSAVATGRDVTLETVSLYRFRHRRIARIDVFTQDTALLLETLRPLPQAPPTADGVPDSPRGRAEKRSGNQAESAAGRFPDRFSIEPYGEKREKGQKTGWTRERPFS